MTIRVARAFGASDEPFTLTPGAHESPDEGLCAMEAAAWLAGHPHSDRPRCTSEVIAAYIRHLNDHMPDEERARLIIYLPQIIGIPEDDWDHLRNELFAWHAVHLFAPAALQHLGFEDHARTLESQLRFWEAKEAADAMVEEFGPTGPDMTPIQWAVYRAGEAANLASWFSSKRKDFFKGARPGTPYGACSEAAAGTAFQAWRVGCEDIWDLALFTLEEVLLIGREKDNLQPITQF
jgi:hypothetical protein